MQLLLKTPQRDKRKILKALLCSAFALWYNQINTKQKQGAHNLRILIDADGCPVTGIAIDTAKENHLEAIIFCDTSHLFDFNGVKTITVSKGADSADFALVNEITEGDIIVTQDYGLAAMTLSRKGRPITQNGLIISDGNLNSLLAARHIAKKARMAGKHLKGPKKRTKEQDSAFKAALSALINEK